jgi:hypothetical protein
MLLQIIAETIRLVEPVDRLGRLLQEPVEIRR